tara:strand:- start:317 stop:541 length:225 start_codon:yes stop_codon:yes gene_type:complete
VLGFVSQKNEKKRFFEIRAFLTGGPMARPAIGANNYTRKKKIKRPGRHKKRVKRKAPTLTSRFAGEPIGRTTAI